MVNQELEGKIEADDIKISPFEGMQITNLRILAAQDTVAKIEHVSVHYSFSLLLKNYLYIKSIDIINPKIKLIRNAKDSTWNFEHIAKKPKDNTPPAKLNWIFDVKNLIIKNADISINDPTSQPNTGLLDPLHAHLRNLNLNLRAKADLKNDKIFADLRFLQFDEKKSNLQISLMGFQVNANKQFVEFGNFKINTNYFTSDIYLKTDKLNIFDGVTQNELENSDLTLNFDIRQLQLLFLNKLVDSLPQIDEKMDFKAEITGNMNKIKIKQFGITRGGSNIHISGKIDKPLKPEELYYDVVINNSNLYDVDLKKIKTAFDLSFTKLDRLFIRDIKAKGNFRNLDLITDIETSFGDISGKSRFVLVNIPSYNSKLKFSHLNFGSIFNDASLTSNLNGELELIGKGIKPENIQSSVKINMLSSNFQNYDINSLGLGLQLLPNKKIHIDSLNLVLNNTFTDSTNFGLSKHSSISASGDIDFANNKMPVYNFDISLNEFNFASIMRTSLAPQYLDTKISVSGHGLNPDSIEAKLNAEILACVFGNRALMPFNLDLNVERFGKTGRLILLNSELFNLQLEGEYQLEDFIQIADFQVKELVTFINKKVFTFYYNNADSLNYHFRHNKRGPLKPFTMVLNGDIKDLTPIGIAVGQPHLSGKAKLDLYVDVEPYRSIMDIRKLDVTSFQYKDGLVNLAINPTEITGKVDMFIEDSVPRFDKIALSIDGKTESFINELSFDKPKVSFDYSNEKMNLAVSSDLNRIMRLDTKGSITFTDTEFKLLLDSTRIALNEDFKWRSYEPINLELSNNGLDIKRMIFKRDSSERISLFGKINTSNADSIILEVTDFPLNQAAYFLPDAQKMYAKNTRGKIQKLRVVINDSLENPRISMSFNTGDVFFYNRYAGKFFGSADYSMQNLIGGIYLKDSTLSKDFLVAKVNSLPIDLSLKVGGQRIIDDRKIDLSIIATNAPLNLVNPFLPEVITNMNGIADARLDITGTKYNLDYMGNINAKFASFLMTVNNIYYGASGKITITNENITLNSIEVKNDKNDLSNSQATVDGSLIFRNFNIEKFDLKIRSKSIKLLDMKSIKTMPDLYGDFVISSGKIPIHFYGTFTDPYLEGDLNVLKAKINMPLVESSNQIPKSRFTYEIKGRKLTVTETQKDSLLSSLIANATDSLFVKSAKKEEEAPNFADILNYNLDVTFVNPMEVNMEMPIGEVFAIVSTQIPNSPIHYYVNPKNNINTIVGDLIVKNNSTFKYIKLFNLTGDIKFPTGDMNNPELNLKAEYNGKSSFNGLMRNYKVNMYIRGYKNTPQVSFDYSIDDEPIKGDSAKIREDALFLVLFGVTKSEFENPTSSSKSSAIDDLGAASLAAVLSKSVTDMLSGTGFITSADIDLQGGSFQNAKLKLSGQIFGMTWNVGGTIADVMNGYEFTAEIPIGLLLFPEKVKSLFLLFSTSVNPTSYVSRNQKNWEVKIKFGGDF